MSTFVIVHGAWGGGWEWSEVASRLQARGHRVLTPTLTGLGERSHLAVGKRIGLSTHVDDIVAVVEFERLEQVVLCGASYGGMAVTGAADRLGDPIRAVVYVDALVPTDGQCALDLLPAPFGEVVRRGLAEHGDHWRIPLPAALRDALIPPGALADDVRVAYLARLRDHPAATFTDPLHLTGPVDEMPRAFVRCTAAEFGDEVGGDPVAASAARARAQGWPYRELTTRHDPQVFEPERLAALLEELGAFA